MSWIPNGPRFVFAPREDSFHRLSRRNEGGRQGLVARIAIEPGDPSTIYTVVRPTSGGVGLFRSSGAGTPAEDWTSLVDALQQSNPSIDPSCVAINPVTPSTIFMGTWNAQSVYVSLDRGATWGAPVYLGARIRKLLIDPRTAGDAAATVIYAATDQGVYRSADSGSTWTNVLAGDVWSLCASMPTGGGGPDAYYAGVLRSGVYTTADPTGGWTNLNAAGIGLPAYDPTAPGGENFNVVYADLCPQNPSRLYVVLLSGGGANFSALYTTSAPTTSWSAVPVGATKPDTAYGFYWFFGVYDFAFAVAPNSPGDGVSDVLFFGGLGFWRSADGGKTWTAPPDILHADHHEIVFYPAQPPAGTIPTVYFGCDGGLAVSDRYCDPTVDITVAPPDFDDQNAYTDTGIVQNYDHGVSSVATYAYASHPAISALQYTAAQDTGAAGGVKTGVWRSLADADATQIAIAPGADGVKVWFDLGQFGGWPSYRVLMATDQGQYGAPSTFVTSSSGASIAATTQFMVTPAGACLLGMQSLDSNAPPSSSNPIRNTVGRLDQSGGATRISQDFSPADVTAVTVGFGGVDVGYCATSDERLWTTPSVAAAGAATVWTEITTSKSASIGIASIAVDAGGAVYVLASGPVTSGSVTTPLFRISGGSWTAQSCTGLPVAVVFGKLLADPVQAGVLYAAAGARIYRLTQSGAVWSWQDISDNLPGQPVYDLWIGNAGNAVSPKVLLRAAIPSRGVWELDVTNPPAAGPLPISLYLRDNLLDQGLLPVSPDGLPSPYAPADPNQAVVHWACADIKVDAQQEPGGSNPAFFQTDPEGGASTISAVAFDAINDNSQNLPTTDAARVHVQVHNRSLTPANDVLVWAVYANAGAGLPSLGKSASYGDAFPFWSQFTVTGGVAAILPNLPPDSPWHTVGAPVTLSGVDAAHPQVASWSWTVPILSSGDPGHYCVAAFVHSVDNPLAESDLNLDNVTPRNRLVGQKNLHIGPPLPAHPGPHGSHRAMREYVEFNNPYGKEMEFDLIFDLRSLPEALEAQLQLSSLRTAEPLERSLSGIASSHHGTLLDRREPGGKELGQARRKAAHVKLPEFVDTIYVAHRATRVMVHRVRIGAYERVGAFLSITNTGSLPPGAQYRFTVRQIGQRELPMGGSTYVVNIEGRPKPTPRIVAPSHDYARYLREKTVLPETDPTSLPRWVRYWINAQRQNVAGDVIGDD